jgi:hypothetical protein
VFAALTPVSDAARVHVLAQLENDDDGIRCAAISGLRHFPPEIDLQPVLVRASDDSEVWGRNAALCLLADRNADINVILDACARALKDEEGYDDWVPFDSAVSILDRLGRKAEPLWPELLELLQTERIFWDNIAHLLRELAPRDALPVLRKRYAQYLEYDALLEDEETRELGTLIAALAG